MTTRESEGSLRWEPTWTQAVTDFRAEDDEAPFNDVTVRMTVPASIGGDHVRAELSNRFGDEPVLIARAAIAVNGRFIEVSFDGQSKTNIAPGESRWTDPIALSIQHGDEIIIDLYLPTQTPYATAGGFVFDRSIPGDFTGARQFPFEGSVPEAGDESREFPATNTGTGTEPDGTGWSLPAGGPFLRAIEVTGAKARAVVVALGGSSTAMGWPQYTAGLLPAASRIAVVNRGVSGNRIRFDAPQQTPSWGRAGLARFNEDVLATNGVTHVVVAYNSNDWTLPGRVTSMDEMPSLGQLIDGYKQLIDLAEAAGLQVILATVTALAPESVNEPDREDIRLGLNDWIRGSGTECVDFDAAIRSQSEPSRLEAKYAAPDNTHPNVNGEKRLAQAMIETIRRFQP